MGKPKKKKVRGTYCKWSCSVRRESEAKKKMKKKDENTIRGSGVFSWSPLPSVSSSEGRTPKKKGGGGEGRSSRIDQEEEGE